MKCVNCDNETGLMDRFCAKCGAAVQNAQPDQSPTIEFAPITNEDIQKDAATKEVIAEAEQEIAQAEQEKNEQAIVLDGVDKTIIEVKPVDQPITAPLQAPQPAVAQVVEEPKAMPLPDLEVKPVVEQLQQTEHPQQADEEQASPNVKEAVQPTPQDEAADSKKAEEHPNQEITLPRNMAPISTGNYFLYYVLMCIPFVNIILALVWSFSTRVNINRRNMARASLLAFGIMLCMVIILLSIGIFLMINSPNIIGDFLNLF